MYWCFMFWFVYAVIWCCWLTVLNLQAMLRLKRSLKKLWIY